MSEFRKRYSCHYYYPGLLFPEDVVKAVEGRSLADVVAAQPNNGWYGATVDEITEELFESPTYGETAVARGSVRVADYIVGTAHHYDALPDDVAASPHASILRSNIRVNDRSGGYGVLTRCGNWQIRSDWQTLISPDHPAVAQETRP